MRAKIAFFNKHLDLSVVVYMNPRVEGVIVPLHLKQRAMIYLQFGHGFPTPIRNLEVDDDGIRATLSFDQKPFDCVIPWESVYGLQCGETVQAWPENFPPELRPQQTHDTAGITLFDLKSKAQRARQRLGSLGVVIVDYLQLMRAGRGSKSDSREQEVSEISRGGKELAKELNTTLVLLSQLNRKCEERADKRPLLSDLRESGSIEQDADVVLFLYRDEYYNKDSSDQGIAEVICVKQRSGATGTARVGFEKHLTRFHDLDAGNVTRLPQRGGNARPRRYASGDAE